MNFPSGPWIGFYNYGAGGQKHRMDLFLNFSNGRISGDGIDDIGCFTISGGFDGQSGECHWTKAYIGQHSVYYRGYREGRGIWGLWEVDWLSGGFHIWPLGDEEHEEEAQTAETSVAVESVASNCVNRGVCDRLQCLTAVYLRRSGRNGLIRD